MLSKSLSEEEDYQLDIAGYIILRNVLTSEEVRACNHALDTVGETHSMLKWSTPFCDPFILLRDHPTVKQYLEQICIDGFRLNEMPQLLSDTVAPNQTLTGGNEPRNWSRSYFQAEHTRFVQGIVAIWALTDTADHQGGFTLIPGTHKSEVKTPSDVLNGTDDMGLSVQPTLAAGDLLLCVETILQGMRPWQSVPQRLLRFGYIGSLVRRSNEAPAQEGDRTIPEWTDQMTPEQRVILGIDRPNPGPIVNSDGKRTWLEKKHGTFHPSIFKTDPDSGIDEKEFYFWDLCGHLVIRDVMDAEWILEANEAIDAHKEKIEKGKDLAHGSNRLAGTGLSNLSGLFEFEPPHCNPFRRMIAHPAIVQRLNWMSGSGFVLDAARAIIYEKGTSGHGMHSGPVPGTPRSAYKLQNGRTYCETVNVTWALVDQNYCDGGFVAIPGSHKCRLPLPECLKTMDNELGLVKHVPLKAGDVVLFMGSAQIHGAYPWTNDNPRRAVIMNFVSRALDQPPRRF